MKVLELGGGNLIEDIFSLSKLKNLEELNISRNPLKNFEDLGNITSLKELTIIGLKAVEIKFLKYFQKLSRLYAGVNKISDLSFFINSPKLDRLWLNSNLIRIIPQRIC